MSEVSNAFDVAERFWAKGAPVDVDGIIRALGIEYVEKPLPSSVSGYIEHDGDGYQIVVNEAHSLARKRFTAAHELGHYVYHRELIGDGIYDGVAYRTDDLSSRFRNPKVLLEHETQANKFAAIVLMPSRLIDKLQAENNLSTNDAADVARLAKLLGVSEQAMRIRLGVA